MHVLRHFSNTGTFFQPLRRSHLSFERIISSTYNDFALPDKCDDNTESKRPEAMIDILLIDIFADKLLDHVLYQAAGNYETPPVVVTFLSIMSNIY